MWNGEPLLVNPSRTDFALAVFLGVWVTGWSFGGLAIRTFFRDPDPLLALFILAWVPFEVVGVTALAYNLAGRETVTYSGESLRIRVGVGFVGRSWEYRLADVKNLRVSRRRFLPQGRRRGRKGLLSDFDTALAFDYQGKTVVFGRGLDESEASEIAGLMAPAGLAR